MPSIKTMKMVTILYCFENVLSNVYFKLFFNSSDLLINKCKYSCITFIIERSSVILTRNTCWFACIYSVMPLYSFSTSLTPSLFSFVLHRVYCISLCLYHLLAQPNRLQHVVTHTLRDSYSYSRHEYM